VQIAGLDPDLIAMRTKLVTLALALLIPVGGVVAQSRTILPVPLKPVVAAEHRSCAQRTPSGLGYSVLSPAAGKRPTLVDVAQVNYIGYLAANGEVFDQSNEAILPVTGLIDGFTEALQLMPLGSIYRFCVPAALGYGTEGVAAIPPNAELVFQVELIDVRSRAEIEAAMKAQAGPADDAANSATQPDD
jgi:FKBP-type peptidyl-prolyl cis-trans isomerase FkpA